MIRLHDLLRGLVPLDFSENPDITGLTQDSRQVKPGDLFCAYPGTQTDGRHYIAQAVEKGASAIIMEPGTIHPLPNTIPIIAIANLQHQLSDIAARFYHNPSAEMTLIGITGTNGKTSCTHFIASALAHTGQACGVMGSMSNGIYYPNGEYQALEPNANRLTTPDAIALQRTLQVFREKGIHTIALEASSHGITQGRLNNLQFKIAAFTNLSRDHLDYHGTMAHYAAAKHQLFSWPHLQYAVLNTDDAYSAVWQRTLPPSVSAYTYGMKQDDNSTNSQHCSATPIAHTTIGLSANIQTPWGSFALNHEHLLGEFNLSNLLLVITVLGILEIPLSAIQNAIHQLEPIQGRMERLKGKPSVIIDYAHTPDALERALESLHTQKGQLWCVFGCGGDRDRGKRPLMGAIAEQHAQQVVITDDNPRYESSQQIIDDICTGLKQPEKAIIIPDRKTAIQYALQQVQPDDVILIAGKGHETYQLIGDQKMAFSDHAIARDLLNVNVAQ